MKNIRFKSNEKLFQYSRRLLELFCTKDYGLNHLFIRSGILIFYWLITFIIVYYITFGTVNDIWTRYREYSLITQVNIEENLFEFPDITICPKSPFSDIDSDEFNDYMKELKSNTKNLLRKASVKLKRESEQSSVLLQLLDTEFKYEPKLFLHILYCRYNGLDCSFYNFTEITHPRYIRCFLFKPNKRLIRSGEGLTIIYYASNLQPSFMFLNDLEDLNIANDKSYDGINVLVHSPLTFPSYEMNYMSTSFPLRYGTHTKLKVSNLKFSSNPQTKIPCYENPIKFQYKNFRGSSRLIEFNYTYEDCVYNKKQEFIKSKCGCFTDEIFVPNDMDAKLNLEKFCHYLSKKTSDQIRNNFFCHEIQSRLSSSEILNEYISPEILLKFKNNSNKLKILRLNICKMLCVKYIYRTKLYEVHDIKSDSIQAREFKLYKQKLDDNDFNHSVFNELYNSDSSISGKNLIIFEIKNQKEKTDIWQEDRSTTWVNLASDIGGIFNLGPGISFLMAVMMILYCSLCLSFFILYLILEFWNNFVMNSKKSKNQTINTQTPDLSDTLTNDTKMIDETTQSDSISSESEIVIDRYYLKKDSATNTKSNYSLDHSKTDNNDQNSSEIVETDLNDKSGNTLSLSTTKSKMNIKGSNTTSTSQTDTNSLKLKSVPNNNIDSATNTELSYPVAHSKNDNSDQNTSDIVETDLNDKSGTNSSKLKSILISDIDSSETKPISEDYSTKDTATNTETNDNISSYQMHNPQTDAIKTDKNCTKFIEINVTSSTASDSTSDNDTKMIDNTTQTDKSMMKSMPVSGNYKNSSTHKIGKNKSKPESIIKPSNKKKTNTNHKKNKINLPKNKQESKTIPKCTKWDYHNNDDIPIISNIRTFSDSTNSGSDDIPIISNIKTFFDSTNSGSDDVDIGTGYTVTKCKKYSGIYLVKCPLNNNFNNKTVYDSEYDEILESIRFLWN